VYNIFGFLVGVWSAIDSPVYCVYTVQVFQVCGQPNLGMRSKRAASRRNQGEGRRRGHGEGRRRGDRGGRRRRRTTPSFLDHDEDDDDDDEVMSPGFGRRRTHLPQTTVSSSTTSPPLTSGLPTSVWMNVTISENGSEIAEEDISTLSTTTVSTSTTGSGPLSTTDSRPRRTRRPRRNRNRGSRRRKNQRTSTVMMSITTEPMYFPDAGEHPLWGMEQHRQHRHREGGSASRLERLIAQIRNKLTMNRDFVTQMPRSLCSTMTSPTERRCWNGTTYSRSVLYIR